MKTLRQFQVRLSLIPLLFSVASSGLAEALPSLQLSITDPTPANEYTRSPELTWVGVPGVVYRVQSTTNLTAAASWVTVEAVTATTTPIRWTAPEVIKDSRYYRLQAQPEIISLEPSFVDASDTNAVLYLLGQFLPTNATVVINGQSFIPTIVNSNGVWATVSLNGLPPGEPVIGLLTVIDNGTSNVVATLPMQSPVFYGTEATAEQLQGPPDEPPASPSALIAMWLSKRGYDYYKARSDLAAVGAHTNPYFQENNLAGEMPTAARQATRGHVTVLKASADDPADEFTNRHRGHVTVLKAHADDPDGDAVDVFPATGELRCAVTDLAIPGRGLDFAWTRTYRSRTGPATAQGAGWDFSYNVSLDNLTASTVTLHTGDGRSNTFYRDGTNGWFRDEYFLIIGDLDGDGVPDRVNFPDGGQWVFHAPGTAAAGKLHQIIDRHTNTMTLNYDVAGRLATIVDDLGRTNTVAYNPAGAIESVTDFSGRTVRYEYDPHGDLTASVSPAVMGTPTGNDFPGGITNRYAYTSGNPDGRLNHNLTSCTDGKGQTWLQVVYQATNNPASIDFDAVATLQRGIDKKDIRRGMVIARPDNRFAVIQAIVNDYVGNVTESFYDSHQRCLRQLAFTGRANPALPTTATENRPTGKLRAEDPEYFETRWTWNPDSLCTSETRPNGDSTEIVHQRAQDYNSSRSNKTASRRHDGDVRVRRERASSPVDLDGDGVTDTSELVWRFEYDPRFGSPANSTRVMIHKIHRGEDLPSALRGPRQSTSLDDSGANSPIIRGSALGGSRIESAKVIVDRDTGRSKGFGFCTTATDPRGSISTAVYDGNGNCIVLRLRKRPEILYQAWDDVLAEYNTHGQLTTITNAPDANGLRRVDAFSYYASGPQAGYLESIVIDKSGAPLATTFEYDLRGNLTRRIDPRTNDWLFTYNTLDQCVRRESPVNVSARGTTDYVYDENGNLVKSTTALRDETDTLLRFVDTHYAYDSLDRCTAVARQVAKAHFVTNRFDYDANDHVVVHYSPLAASGADLNARTVLEYDERGLPFRRVAAPGTGQGATNQWDYDPNGSLRVTKVDSLTLKQVAFDGLNRPVSITDALGNVVTCAFDRNDNLVFTRVSAETNDVSGSTGNLRYQECRWQYDARDQCVESRAAFFDPATQLPLGDGESVTTCTYAPNGDCLSLTDDNGHTTRYAYDTAGRCAQITDPKTNLTLLSYDAGDNLTSVVSRERPDSAGPEQQFTRTYVYDALGRCVRSWDNVGNTNRSAYDSLDRVVRRTDPNGGVSWSFYDDLGRKTRGVGDLDGDGAPDLALDVDTTWTFDDNSRCVAITDDNTNTTVYAYDSLDRCVMKTEPDGTSCNLIWSPRSNLIRRQDANGTVVSNRFDLLDRCVRSDMTPGVGVAATTTFETFAYDGRSRCVAAGNDVSLLTFAYDSLGNCVRSTQDGLASFGTFDGVGNCLTKTYPGGRIVSCTYNPLDEVTSLSSSAGGGQLPVTLATYAYEGPGRVGRISRGNNINTRMTWDGLLNPANAVGDFGWRQVNGINHQVSGGGAIIDRRVSAYDHNQNKTLRAQTTPFFVGGPTTTNLFAYDALDRLTQFTRAAGSPADWYRAYTLDGSGNRLLGLSNGVAAPYVMDNTLPDPADFQVNQYTLTPFGQQSYDPNGNLVSRVSPLAERQYLYDYADRLVHVTDLSSGTPTPVVSFSYNALGQRNTLARYPAGLPPIITQFVHDYLDDDSDGDIIEEYQGGVLAVSSVSALAGGAGGGAAAASYAATGRAAPPLVRFNSAGEATYLLADELGNVIALTDASGKVLERCDYDDHGAPIFLSTDGVPTGEMESGVGNPFLFRGMEWDVETGFYHCPSGGYFDPLSGQSTSRDLNGGMPNRISMNFTVPKQTQGATFGKRVNAGLASGAGKNPWSGGGGGRKVQFNPKEVGLDKSTPWHKRAKQDVYVWKIKRAEGGRHTPFHNRMLGGALPGGAILSAAVSSVAASGAGGTKLQDHNSSRSNKSRSLALGGGDPAEGVIKFVVKK